MFSFSNLSFSAKTILDLTPVTPSNQPRILDELETLQTEGMTNLWGGLRLGMDILKHGYQPNRLSSLFLLTDGLPNIPPPRGINT